jgi:YidC/Oxa1 family membrane protein insertase
MERRAIVATVLALVVLLVYQAYFAPVPQQPTEPQQAGTEEAKPEAVPRTARPAAPAATAPKPRAKPARMSGPLRRAKREEKITLETDLLKVVRTNRGGAVQSWELKQYQEADGPVDLVGALPDNGAPLPLSTSVDGGEGAKGLYRVVERPSADRNTPQRIVMEFQEARGILLEKTIVLHPGRYLADVEVRLKNLSGAPVQGSLRLQWGPGFRIGANDRAVGAVTPAAWIDGELVNPDMEEVEQEITQPGAAAWTALQDRYFAAALVPDEPGPSGLLGKDADGRPIVGLLYPAQEISAGGETTARLKLYAGPKEITRLRDAGHDLRELVYLGWFDFLARPALYFLRFLHGFVGNYGVAIVIITLLQKIAFYPLAHKSHKSMHAMQTLQPRIQAIKDKYKNNPQKVNQETMELYKRHGVNPLGGCLPMVIQIPIFIALYNALASSVELWRAPFTLWITDLSVPDTLFALPFALPYLGEAFPLRGLPLIMGLSMFIQQKMSPTGGDPRQAQMMLYLMPVMFTFIFWGMPSGLVLYWLINNVLQMGHQYQMNRGFSLQAVTGKEPE